jgi:hypothetical protein
MRQSKTLSFVESMTNILIGYTINLALNMIFMHHKGYMISMRDGVELGLAFTAVSFLRSYGLRRLFNWIGG